MMPTNHRRLANLLTTRHGRTRKRSAESQLAENREAAPESAADILLEQWVDFLMLGLASTTAAMVWVYSTVAVSLAQLRPMSLSRAFGGY